MDAAAQWDLACKDFNLPELCPFSIECLRTYDGSKSSLWLIREHDRFGEYPHIYAKICTEQERYGVDGAIVLSDAGCGTEKENLIHGIANDAAQPQPKKWNLRTFLEYTINPDKRLPYVVINTHCHYDHILGLSDLIQPTQFEPIIGADRLGGQVFVVASALDPNFVIPYEKLQKHSLCEDEGVDAPHYNVTTWAKDFEQLVFQSPLLRRELALDITIIHTPGHSPDSLSWYDTNHHFLCVGDSFYSKRSSWTSKASWGGEPDMPIFFNRYSVLADWWAQMDKLLDFVRKENRELVKSVTASTASPTSDTQNPETATGKEDEWVMVGRPVPRVQLAAGHATCGVDAEETLEAVKKFMMAVMRGEVPSQEKENGRILFDYALDGKTGEYSVLVPINVLEEGRKAVFEITA